MAPRQACGVCNINIAGNSSCIYCVECEKWIHFKCTGMDKSQFSKTANEVKYNGLKWKCNECISEVSVIVGDDSLGDHDEHLVQRMEQLFQKFFQPFKRDIAKSLDPIKSDLNNIAQQQNTMNEKHSRRVTRVSAVQNKVNSFNGSGVDTEEVIAEMRERKRRSCNVVALNVPESTKPTGTDRLNEDREIISDLLPEQLVDVVPNLKLRRLGRPGNGKPRRLLIVTPSEECARTILSAQPVADSNVLFKYDQTAAQQLYLKEVRTELEDLIRDGDDSKTIKYYNGVPRIVNKSPFRESQE